MRRAVVICTVLFLMLAIAHGASVAKPKPPKKPKMVKCNHNKKLFPYCRGIKFPCPASCPRSCYVDCQRCSPVCTCDKPGGVCQDPRFVGADGVTFYFHGKRDRDFCLLSDSDLHINAHFIGKPGPARDFTWVQSVAVLLPGNHTLYLGALKTTAWDDSVDRLSLAYDGLPVPLPASEGAMWTSPPSVGPATTVIRSGDANAVTVEAEGKFRITASVVPITEEESRVHNYGIDAEEDCYAHLELGFKFYALGEDVHGVLGQTYREGYVSRVRISAAMPVIGGNEQFSASDLYAADCAVARFGREIGSVGSEVKCGSGMPGSGGIACEK